MRSLEPHPMCYIKGPLPPPIPENFQVFVLLLTAHLGFHAAVELGIPSLFLSFPVLFANPHLASP